MMDRSRIAVILVWKEKRQSVILASENKRLGTGRRSLVRVKSHQRFPRWIYEGQGGFWRCQREQSPICHPKSSCHSPGDTPHLLQAGGVELRLVNDFHGHLQGGQRGQRVLRAVPKTGWHS